MIGFEARVVGSGCLLGPACDKEVEVLFTSASEDVSLNAFRLAETS